MAATVNVAEGNGATPTWTDITSARFCTADNYNPGTSYPIPIPDSGTKYSYWKSHRLEFTGTFTQIDNIKIYTDGTLGWTGCTAKAGDTDVSFTPPIGLADGSYVVASGTEGDTGDVITTHTNIASSADLFGYTSSTPLTVDTAAYTSAGNSKHAVLQLEVTSTASSGTQAAETITWEWDEI